jgi:hypothetical protein
MLIELSTAYVMAFIILSIAYFLWKVHPFKSLLKLVVQKI